MLSVTYKHFMLSVIMLNDAMLCNNMPNGVMLNAVMVSVVAPQGGMESLVAWGHQQSHYLASIKRC